MIKPKSLVFKVLNKKETRDYTYAILFFIVSSFFAVFVIKPVLTVAVSLNKKSKDLAVANAILEKNIMRVIEIQSMLEGLRNSNYLIENALPSRPFLRDVIDLLIVRAQQNGIVLDKFDISPVSYIVTDERALQSIEITISFEASYNKIIQFINDILLDKRLIEIVDLKIQQANGIKENASDLKTTIKIKAFYLKKVI